MAGRADARNLKKRTVSNRPRPNKKDHQITRHCITPGKTPQVPHDSVRLSRCNGEGKVSPNEINEIHPTGKIDGLTVGNLQHLPPVLSIPEVAKLLKIGRNTAYELARQGQIPTIKLGRRLVVPTPRIIDLLNG